MSTHTLTHDHADSGTFRAVLGSAVAGHTQLVCDADSTPVDSYLRTCTTCHGRLSLPVPVTGVNLTVPFISWKGRTLCPACQGFGSVTCDADGVVIDD